MSSVDKSKHWLMLSFVECVSNVDDVLGEMFLEEKTPTEKDIEVSLRFIYSTATSFIPSVCL